MALPELTVSVIEPHMLDDLITSFAPRLEHVGWIDPRHGLLGLGVVTNPQYARPVYAFVGDGLKWAEVFLASTKQIEAVLAQP